MYDGLRVAMAVSLMNLGSLWARREASAVVAFGMAAVAFLFVALFAMSSGLQAAIAGTGQDDRALILGAGSNSEINGSIKRAQAEIIRTLPGIATARDTPAAAGAAAWSGAARLAPEQARALHAPLLSAEIFATANLARADRVGVGALPLRGVSADAFRVRPEVRVTAGRPPKPGRFEMLAGEGAAQTFANLAVGDTVSIKGVRWRVVGHFTSGGSATASEAWMDLDVMANVFRRGVFLNSLTVRLTSPAALAELQPAIAQDRRLACVVFRESEFYRAQAQDSTRMMSMVGIVAGTIVALGALFSALNVLYGSVSARTREIATLKALGFGPGALVGTVMSESMLLAAVGGTIGAAVGGVVFHGYRMTALGGTYSEVAFAFDVSPRLLGSALAITLLLGFLGGCLPAIRAARLDVVRGLRSVA